MNIYLIKQHVPHVVDNIWIVAALTEKQAYEHIKASSNNYYVYTDSMCLYVGNDPTIDEEHEIWANN